MAAPFDAFRRRLAPRFDVSAWPVLLVQAIPAATREAADARVNTPAHWLAAAWPPVAQGLDRWPEAVVIGSPAPDNALAELVGRLPGDARLCLVDADAVDAALAADILLAADRNLEPYQRDALARFAAVERARVAARVTRDYTDHDPAFARFRDGLAPPRS
jgi:hypothetical protein